MKRANAWKGKLVVLALVVMVVAAALVVPVVAGAVARVGGDGSTAAVCQSGHACGGAPVAAMCQSGFACGGAPVAIECQSGHGAGDRGGHRGPGREERGVPERDRLRRLIAPSGQCMYG